MTVSMIKLDKAQGRRILLLTFYFEPDIGPGPVRNTSLTRKLEERLLPGDEIEVITTLPNRYASIHQEAPEYESRGRVTVRRIPLPVHHSGMRDQARVFLTYAKQVFKLTRSQRYDLVYASSSRLMTAALASCVARLSNAKLYLDIRDIFTETMQEVLSNRFARIILPVFEWLETQTIRRANTVNLVSPGFLSYFNRICRHDYRLFTNGIDNVFMEKDFNSTKKTQEERIILYAGNVGDGQGLHRVIPEAGRLLQGCARFRIIGDGGKRIELEKAVKNAGLYNVEILDPVPRDRLYEYYKEADVLFLHLNDYRAFHRVLPSKLFEYAATGKPILAGVAGCAADFLKREMDCCAVFSPCDAVGLVQALDKLPFGLADRTEFIKCYSRDSIMNRMADDVLGAIPQQVPSLEATTVLSHY